MLVVLSPAKALDWETPEPNLSATPPRFAGDTAELVAAAGALDADALGKLMKISANLSRLNRDRFAAFRQNPCPEDTRSAVFAFAGDTYRGLEARTLDPDALDWARGHLRILSGLYGVLRPGDQIQPYRLEMGSRLRTARGRSLYDFWSDRLAHALNEDAAQVGAEVLVNCASVEYFAAVDRDALALRVITPVFMEDREGGPRIVSFHAKRARGAMARFIMENRIADPEALQEFDAGGYAHAPDLSEPDRPVFIR